MPTVGAGVGLVVAGSWTGSRTELGEQQPHALKTRTSTSPSAVEERAASSVRGTLDLGTAALRCTLRAPSQGSLAEPMRTRGLAWPRAQSGHAA